MSEQHATLHNDLSGATREVVQAGRVGSVHFHQRAGTPDLPPRQLPADVRGFVNRTGDLARLDLLLSGGNESDENATAVCRVDEAADFHRLAVSVFRDTGEGWRLATALDHLALSVTGAEAEEHWLEAHRLLTPFSDPHAVRLRQEIENRLD